MRTRYDEVPPDAPKPKMWKCLGHIGVGLEAHYALENWHGDLDVDREHDLAVELSSCATLLVNNGQPVDGVYLVKQESYRVQGDGVADRLVFGWSTRQRMVRFVACDCATRPIKEGDWS